MHTDHSQLIPPDFVRLTTQDATALRRISKLTFVESYAWGNSDESMQRYMHENFSLEKLIIELNNPLSEFYFACVQGEPIAYLKVNVAGAQTELKEDGGLEIERIYVLKEFQGMKTGRLLCHKAFEIARRQSISFVWLGVWAENTGALMFYEKMGFLPFDKHIFRLGEEEQLDIMMRRDL